MTRTEYAYACFLARFKGHSAAAIRGCPDNLHAKIARLSRALAYLHKRMTRGAK